MAEIPTSLKCTACKGSTKIAYESFTGVDGTRYPGRSFACNACRGSGVFSAPDQPKIIHEISGRKGLCSKRPSDARAYYVWRMARVHGGADVTMPVCAMSQIHGDPFRDQLDLLADAVAKHVYGTDLAAANRWGMALGHISKPLSGLPPTAYECGPVTDEFKPIEEVLELR